MTAAEAKKQLGYEFARDISGWANQMHDGFPYPVSPAVIESRQTISAAPPFSGWIIQRVLQVSLVASSRQLIQAKGDSDAG